jgi:hypothetical protein
MTNCLSNSKVFIIIINATRSHFFMPFYAYQSFLCLSELFMSVLCLSANKQNWGILCLSARECLFMIVGPKVVRLMLIRPTNAHLMLVGV